MTQEPTSETGAGNEASRPDQAAPPHPDLRGDDFRAAARRVADWVADYRERAEELPVRAQVEPGEVASALAASPPELGEPLDHILDDVDRIILPGLTHWNHPGFLAYFPSSATAPALLGEFVTAGLGSNAMLWLTSPAGTELEERVVDWLRQAVGLPPEFRGVIQDTASSSSFTALLAARQAAGLEIRRLGLAGRSDLPALIVYVSDQAHLSIEKGAIAAGLGQTNVRAIPSDSEFCMDPEALRQAVRSDREAGRRPLFVCATLGTTSSASVDPVSEIADIALEEGMWLHVDAAYAGPAAILPELRERFAGWERADSLVLNPHKWMGALVDCSVLLFRDPGVFRASLALTPEYVRTGVEGVTNLMDYGLPMGRRFRALKLWFLFRNFGLEGLRSLLRAHIEWATRFAGWVEHDPRFELLAPVSFSTVCFRATGAARRPGQTAPRNPEEVDELNRRLLDAVNRTGRVFMSHTVLHDRYTLRLAVGSVHNRAADVEAAYRGLSEALDALLNTD
jgi:aromatic-L-amino-acid decarboxylase